MMPVLSPCAGSPQGQPGSYRRPDQVGYAKKALANRVEDHRKKHLDRTAPTFPISFVISSRIVIASANRSWPLSLSASPNRFCQSNFAAFYGKLGGATRRWLACSKAYAMPSSCG